MYKFLIFIVQTVSTKRNLSTESELDNQSKQMKLNEENDLLLTDYDFGLEDQKSNSDEEIFEGLDGLNDVLLKPYEYLINIQDQENILLDESIPTECLLPDFIDNEEVIDSNLNTSNFLEQTCLPDYNSDNVLEINYTNQENKNTLTPQNEPIRKSNNSFQINKEIIEISDDDSIYKNFDLSKLTYEFAIESNVFGLKEYFDKYIIRIPKTNLQSTMVSLNKSKERMFYSINLSTLLVFRSIHKEKNFKFYVLELTNKLENRFAFRIDHTTRQTNQNISKILQDIFCYFDDENVFEVFHKFYRKYIFSDYVLDYFKKTENYCLPGLKLDLKISILLEKFNTFYFEYSHTVNQILDQCFKPYSVKIAPYFFSKNNQIVKETLQIYITDLLYNKINCLLVILFPEIKLILENLADACTLRFLYMRFHFFFSLLVCKLNYNLPKLKYEFDKSSFFDNFLITDSKFFNIFVLEIRLFICVSCLTLLNNLKQINLIFLKAFISFVRCRNPDFLDYFLLNEFTPLDHFIGLENHIEIFLKAFEKGSKNLPKLNIQSIDNKLISEDYYRLNELERIEKLIQISETKKKDDPKMIESNANLIQKISEFLIEYFRKFD
ncbi:hypothetical protein TUBRATIS_24190 [Tubulinosema ratisbonensis]|uniref:Uncharacterized protein n=1 Tax=Tubulinosema ratisbonensis TaxID=291195 RepID=A0A437AJ65_9MICR|nr:hypothetical protein TUBRATIS_24190 [Tubulinosema ratisbonensis]